MKRWGIGFLGVALTTAGCLDFAAAEAAFCSKAGCAAAPGTDTLPGVNVSGNPMAGATTHSTLAQLALTAVPSTATVSGFQCQLDGAAFASCTSPVALRGLEAGNHSLQIRALNAQGQAGPVTTYSWTVSALATTIHDIRTLPVESGTLVSLSGPTLQLTIAAADRFYMQEATTPFSGITVQPTVFDGADPGLVHGLAMSAVGTLAEVNGNTTVVNATYTRGTVLDGYDARFGGQDNLPLLAEGNEGMWVYDPGTAVSCSGFDFCLHDCDGVTLGAVNAVRQGLTLNTPHDFLGVMEGNGAASWELYASEEQTGSDTCGP